MQTQGLFSAVIDEDVLRYQFVKKKGYVRLHTNKGDLNLELHCDLVSMVAVSGWFLVSNPTHLLGCLVIICTNPWNGTWLPLFFLPSWLQESVA